MLNDFTESAEEIFEKYISPPPRMGPPYITSGIKLKNGDKMDKEEGQTAQKRGIILDGTVGIEEEKEARNDDKKKKGLQRLKIDGGATIWARQTIDSEIFYNKPEKWFKIWFYLVNKVNYEDSKQFPKGSCFMKYEWIMEKTKATRNEVDHCIRWLKSATMIETQKAIRGFTVNVLKYPDFQNLQNYKSDTKNNTKSETKAKQKRNKSDTISKNLKNDKKVLYNLFEFWNSLKIMRHKKINAFVKPLEKVLKTYSEKELRKAMVNYATVVKGEKYFFKYRWTLAEFLKRGFEKFLDINMPLENFLVDKDDNKREKEYPKYEEKIG